MSFRMVPRFSSLIYGQLRAGKGVEEMGSMLDLQSLEASSDAIDPRASGASFMCNGDNSSVSLWCG